MKSGEAIKHFTEMLKKDKEMRRVFKDNIAMTFKDHYSDFKRKNDKACVSNADMHIIANDASDYFLKLLCEEIEFPVGR